LLIKALLPHVGCSYGDCVWRPLLVTPSDITTIFVCMYHLLIFRTLISDFTRKPLRQRLVLSHFYGTKSKGSRTRGQGSNCQSRKEQILNKNSRTAPFLLATSGQLSCCTFLRVSEPTSVVTAGALGLAGAKFTPAFPWHMRWNHAASQAQGSSSGLTGLRELPSAMGIHLE